MAPSKITTSLAEESDAVALTQIVTAAFAAGDAAYTIIWGSAPEGTHDNVVLKFIFSTVQKEDRITYKAVDEESGKIVGLATWMMQRERPPLTTAGGRMPPIEGVNTDLWNEKHDGPAKACERDEDPEKDMRLALLFVLPEFQRRGIGSLLLEWGMKKADELGAKIWLTATPKATPVYEQSGWKIVERFEFDLTKYGVEEPYVRSWMVREPTLP